MAKIYYMRHGQASLFSDNYDNLSEIGWEQSHRTGVYFKNKKINFDKVYIGPLVRHNQTYEGIKKTYDEGDLTLPNPNILVDLAEHEGPKVVKALLPELIMENEFLNKIASRPAETKNAQIKNYMRLYQEVTQMWVRGDLDNRGVEHQSWLDFRKMAGMATEEIKNNTQAKENVLVVTSGGPVAIAIADTLGLTNQKALEISWVTCNSSITTFVKTEQRFSLFNMNTVSALDEERLVTLV